MQKLKIQSQLRSIFLHQIRYITVFIFLFPASSESQIIPDQTLPNNSTVTELGKNFTINNGTVRGTNLFHSFDKFSLPTGSNAFFDNPAQIQNIFSRVTGTSISNIDGLIQANGTANLFLLNPNGILFGLNAQLNIGGSFLGTTANNITFEDGFKFSASDPPSSLLTVSVPIGLDFWRSPGDIRVQDEGHSLVDRDPTTFFTPFVGRNPAVGLQVNPGQTLSLIGGNLTLDGGVLTAEGGKVELGSVTDGFVRISSTLPTWEFDYDVEISFGNIEMKSQSLVDASGMGAGSIQLRGSTINIADASIVLIQNQGLEADGSLRVDASESIIVEGIAPNLLTVAGINTETVAEGQGADISVSAPQIVVDEGSISTTSYSSATGGNLNLFTQNLSIINGGIIGTTTDNIGKGGNINIQASQNLNLTGVSPTFIPEIFSAIATNTRGSGTGGNIEISTRNLAIQGGASIGTNVIGGIGKGGNVTINTSSSIQVLGTSQLGIQSSIISTTFGIGDAGTLEISTPRLLIQNGATIAASTFISGDAGDLVLNVSEFITLEGSEIASRASNPPESLQLVLKLLNLPSELSGASGNVFINAPQLNLTKNSQISVANSGPQNAGAINIEANVISLNTSSITASTASGQGGNVNLDTEQLQLLNNSLISATAGGGGDGGNITINTDTLVALDNSSIAANAFQGSGGNIQIDTQAIFLSPDSEITASSELGIDGIVKIDTENQIRNEVPISVPFLTSEDVIANSCLEKRNSQQSQFFITGAGGVPPSPYSSIYEWQIPESNSSSSQLGEPLVEAQRIVTTADGRIRLDVYPSETGQSESC